MPTQAMPSPLHLEDLQPGQLHRSSGDPVSVTAEGISRNSVFQEPEIFASFCLAAALDVRGLASAG